EVRRQVPHMSAEAREVLAVAITFVTEVAQAHGEKIKALEARLATVEGNRLSYRGVWQAAEQYYRGDLATRDGALWHCNASTRQCPGSGTDWTLAVKAGRGA